MTKHTRRVLELGAGLALALTVVLTAYADWHQRTAAYPGADENALVFGRFEVRLAVADFIGRLASPAGEAVSGLPAD